jgi:hypothetical protein
MMRPATLPILLVLYLSAGSATAVTYTIAPDGSGDFPTIQAGVAAAEHGDTIELLDGTFTGDGNRDVSFLGKAITVRSRSGNPAACIIDCEGGYEDNHRAFLFIDGEDEGSVLEGVTIRNGHMAGWNVPSHPPTVPFDLCPESGVGAPRTDGPNDYLGGAILCGPGTAPTIRNCVFYRNEAEIGGAIGLDNAHPEVLGCVFDDNSASWSDGGAIANGDFLDGQVTVRDSYFVENHASAHGGAIAVSGGRSLVADCLFVDNRSGTGGVFFGCREADAELVRCTMLRNYAVAGGACLY